MTCYFSTGSFLFPTLSETVAYAGEQGLNVELSSAVGYSPDIRQPLRESKGRVRFLVHNYFPPPKQSFVLNLASTDPLVHRRSVKLCRNAIDLCTELDAPFYSVHAGFAFHLSPEDLGNPRAQGKLGAEKHIPREEAFQTFLDTIRELAGYAKSKKVGLLVENNVSTVENLNQNGESPLLLTNIDEIQRFFEKVNDPWVRFLLDVGHAKVSSRTFGEPAEDYFRRFGSRIEALHLSDNDGLRDKHLPFDETAWFLPFLTNFRAKPWVVEASRLSAEAMMAQRCILETI